MEKVHSYEVSGLIVFNKDKDGLNFKCKAFGVTTYQAKLYTIGLIHQQLEDVKDILIGNNDIILLLGYDEDKNEKESS